MFKVTCIYKGLDLVCDNLNYISIGPSGCVFACIQGNSLNLYKPDGYVFKVVDLGDMEPIKVFWVMYNIVVVFKNRVVVMSSEGGVIGEREFRNIACVECRGRRIFVATNDCRNYVMDEKLVDVEEKVRIERALNIFGSLSPLDLGPFKNRRAHKKSMRIKNINSNKATTPLMTKYSYTFRFYGVRQNEFYRKVKFYRKGSITVVLKTNKMIIYNKTKVIKVVKKEIKQVVLKHNRVFYTTRKRIYIYNLDRVYSYRFKNPVIFKIKNGCALLSNNNIYTIDITKVNDSRLEDFYISSSLIYKGENLEETRNVLNLVRSYKRLAYLCRDNGDDYKPYIQSYFIEKINSNELDVNLFTSIKQFLDGFRVKMYFGLAVIAIKQNRVKLAQNLIEFEHNSKKRANFIISYLDRAFLLKTLNTTSNYIFKTYLFQEMKKRLNFSDILFCIQNKNIYTEYKNFLKLFSKGYPNFLRLEDLSDEYFYYRLKNEVVEYNLILNDQFAKQQAYFMKKLRDFQKKNKMLEVKESETVDGTMFYLLKKNDLKNAFDFKYISMMSKYKFEFLRSLAEQQKKEEHKEQQ